MTLLAQDMVSVGPAPLCQISQDGSQLHMGSLGSIQINAPPET